jgi:flagellar biosynthesis chaperone FliJ
MSTSPKSGARFRYPLRPLLDLRHWQLDALKIEMSAATKVLQERQQAVGQVREAVRFSLQAMADTRQDGATLDPQAEGRTRRYIERLDVQLQEKMSELDEARRLHDAVSINLRHVLQAANGLERHRDKLHQAHRAAQEIAASKEADDVWLMSQACKEALSW